MEGGSCRPQRWASKQDYCAQLGAQYDGARCVCPPGTRFEGGACRGEEEQSTNKDDFCAQYGATFSSQTQKCECPHGAPFDPATRRCGPKAPNQQECQNGQEWDKARQRCECPQGETYDPRFRRCQAVDQNAKLQRMVACSTRHGQCLVQEWHAYRTQDRQEAMTAVLNGCNGRYQNSCVFIFNCDQPSGAVVSKRAGSSYSFPYRQCGGASPFRTALASCGYKYNRPNGCGGGARWGDEGGSAGGGGLGGGKDRGGDQDGSGGHAVNQGKNGGSDASKDEGSGSVAARCTPSQITTGASEEGKTSGTAWLRGYKCDGPDIQSLSFLYSWSTFVGEPSFKHRLKWEIGDYMTIKGQYCKIPSELKSSIKINTVTLAADVSSGGARTTSMEVTLPWIQVAAGATGTWAAVGNWNKIFVGKAAEEARQIYKRGFHLGSLRITRINYLGLPSRCPGAK